MGKQSIKRNYLYNTLFQMMSLLISLVTVPYVSRVLGAENIGKYSFANSIASYFVMFAVFGSATFGTRQVSYSRDDKKRLTEDFWDVVSFRMITTILLLLSYYLYLYAFAGVTVLNMIISLNIFNVATDITWLFQGIEDFRKIAVRNLSIKLLCTVMIFTLIKKPEQLNIYVFILCFATILGNASMWIALSKIVDGPQKLHPFKNVKEMLMVFLPTIATQVYTVLDKSMIGIITGSDYENGCYEQAEQIARVSLILVTSIGLVVLPRVGNLYKNKEINLAKEYIYKSYRFVWMLSLPMTAGLFGIAPVLVPVFLGSGFDGAIALLKIFAFLIVLVSLAHITGISYLIPTEQQNVYTIAVSAAAFVNFIMNLFLIKMFQARGAAVASISAELLGLAIQLLYCFKTRQLDWRKVLFPAWKYLVASIIMLMEIMLVRQLLPINIISLVSLVICSVAVYFLVLFIMRDVFAVNILQELRNKKLLR